MVAVDGSNNAIEAFNMTLHLMDKRRDELYIITTVQSAGLSLGACHCRGWLPLCTDCHCQLGTRGTVTRSSSSTRSTSSTAPAGTYHWVAVLL
jgi:hypothetical protein